MRMVPEDRRSVQTGQRFERLVVIGVPFFARLGVRGQISQCAVFECDCGILIVNRATDVKRGHAKSCGCLNRDMKVERFKNRDRNGKNSSRYRHGDRRTRLYGTWTNMLTRCRNPRSPRYRWYGDRGIRVCEEWLDFVAFKAWALSSGYTDELTIDRIDSDGNYEPSNCQWLTREENTRRARAKKIHGTKA